MFENDFFLNPADSTQCGNKFHANQSPSSSLYRTLTLSQTLHGGSMSLCKLRSFAPLVGKPGMPTSLATLNGSSWSDLTSNTSHLRTVCMALTSESYYNVYVSMGSPLWLYRINVGASTSSDSPLNVTLGNASVLSADKKVSTVANIWYYRNMWTTIVFQAMQPSANFCIHMDCINTFGQSSSRITDVTVEAVPIRPNTSSLPFHRCSLWEPYLWSRKGTSHFRASFIIEKGKLAEGGFIKDGELTLRIKFID